MNTATSLSDVLPAEALAGSGPVGLPSSDLAARAEAVVRPQSTTEVAETLRWASANGVGVLPIGSGAGAREVPGHGRFIVLVTHRLAGIEIYEPADVTFTARAGTLVADVQAELTEHGQWLPYDPPRALGRTLGGLVATGESGPVATGYGALRNHVLGATVVLGDGSVLRLGGRVVKNVAGFDLLRPVVGSRGRLCVITSLCLRAFPKPAEDRVLVYRADDLGALAEPARDLRTAPVLPSSLVAWAPPRSTGGSAVLVVRLMGARPTVDADQAVLERHAGIRFEAPEDAGTLAREGEEHSDDGAVTLLLSVLPSRLFEAIASARGVVGDVPVAADIYGGSARFALGGITADTLEGLRREVDKLDGALDVQLPPGAQDLSGLGSTPRPEEVELAAKLEEVFDPQGVFWPCRG